ncbi:MAG: response regulator [Parcubacteria group bacterium]|nr:response regulator [Parcubacteria group bacterium]
MTKLKSDQPSKRYKVLIVEDDKFLLDMYTVKFNEYNFEVASSFGVPDALAKLEEGLQPDILLTDIVMPVMDGFEFLAEIKKRHLAPGAVIIVLSNLGQKEDINKGVSLGASGYIVKATSTPTEVVKKVLEIVEGR